MACVVWCDVVLCGGVWWCVVWWCAVGCRVIGWNVVGCGVVWYCGLGCGGAYWNMVRRSCTCATASGGLALASQQDARFVISAVVTSLLLPLNVA